MADRRLSISLRSIEEHIDVDPLPVFGGPCVDARHGVAGGHTPGGQPSHVPRAVHEARHGAARVTLKKGYLAVNILANDIAMNTKVLFADWCSDFRPWGIHAA